MLDTHSPHRHAPIPFKDEHGLDCLRVPVNRNGTTYAIVTAIDYRRIQRAGATGTWFLNDGGLGNLYVRTSIRSGRGKRTMVTVARLIMDAGANTVVRYANGNRLDLRFWNLEPQKGKAKRADIRLIQRAPDAHPEAWA